MQPGDALGPFEYAVLEAVHRGALRSRRSARQVRALAGRPGGEAILHDVLHRCKRDGLLASERDRSGRAYRLTAAGRARLRADRRFRVALARTIALSRSRASTRLGCQAPEY
jgi:DNA-binding PadR family transcriptional regulator